MLEAYSQIRQTYPLSPRKFWKKMFERTASWFALVTVFFPSIWLIIELGSDKPSGNVVSSIIIGFLIGLAVYLVLIFIPYALYVRAYINRYYYDLNEDFITIKKGVFAPTEIHVQYTKIQDVYVDQDILDRIMGLYDVHIASATVTSGMEAHIDGVNHESAEGLKNLLLSKIKTHATNSTTAQSNVQTSQPINLSQRISSAEYPIQGRWLLSMIGKSFGAIFLLLIISSFQGVLKFMINESSPSSSGSDAQADFISITFLIGFIGLGAVINIIYWAVWKSNYYFEFQPEYILERTQVISKSEKHVPYRSIQNVSVSQGLVERILSICTVTIENAAQGGMSKLTIPGQTVEKGNALVSLTNSITSQIKNQSASGL